MYMSTGRHFDSAVKGRVEADGGNISLTLGPAQDVFLSFKPGEAELVHEVLGRLIAEREAIARMSTEKASTR